MNDKLKRPMPTLQRYMAQDAQYLSPEAIYSLNRVLYDALDELGISPPDKKAKDGTNKVWVVPNLFDKKTRSWHFACVLEAYWGLNDGESDPKKHPLFDDFLIKALWWLARLCFDNKLRDAFDIAKEHLLEGRDYEKAITEIEKHIKNLGLHSEKNEHSCKDIQGLVKKYGSKSGKETKNDIINKFKNNGAATCLAKVLKFKDEKNSFRVKECQKFVRALLLFYHGFRLHRYLYLPGILYRGCEEDFGAKVVGWFEGVPKKDTKCEIYTVDYYTNKGGKLNIPVSANHEHNQLEARLEDDSKFSHEDMKILRGFDVPIELTNLFYMDQLPNPETLPIIVLPIYDTWLGGLGYGGLWGCLICSFLNEKAMGWFERHKLHQLRQDCEFLSAELAISALAGISSKKIVPPYDLIEHFLRTLIHIQDWQRVTVFKGKGEAKKRLYCYRRYLEGEKKDGEKDYRRGYDWKRCNGSCSDMETDGENVGRILSWECVGPHQRKVNSCEEHASNDCSGCPTGRTRFRSTIWNKELIPELTGEEISSFGEISFEFEFPKSAFVPVDSEKNDKTYELFELALIEQQIEVLRTLIPKVRARRAALRNAAVSIMGRNMSHNIGSHVLARYSASEKDLFPEEDVKQFTQYLQERMDFIADVSTTDVFYSLPTRFYGEAITGLIGDKGKSRQKILLEYISGLTGIKMEISLIKTDDKDSSFASPGGRLGLQALYVILENIARNTAKHAQGIDEEVKLHVRITDNKDFDGYHEVLVWDDLSIATKKIGGEEGKELPVWINEDVLNKPMIEDEGSIKPNYWGIREIFLAAAYLRSIPLDELESRNTLDAKPPVLEAIVHDGGEKEKFGYRFYLEKAKLLFEIGEKNDTWATDKPSEGIKVIEVSSVGEILEGLKKAAESSIWHSYGIFPDEAFNELTLEEKLYLPIMHFEKASEVCPSDGVERDIAFADAWCEKFMQDRVGKNDYELSWTEEGSSQDGALTFKNRHRIISQDKLLLFDKHNSFFKLNKLDKDIPFYEQFRSKDPQSAMILETDKSELYQPLFKQAALTQIIILDERLQAVLSKTDDDTKDIWENLFPLKGIFIPSKGGEDDESGVDLDKVDEEESEDKFFQWLAQRKDSCRLNREKKYDFIVIHQTIIDKLRGKMGAINFDDRFQEVAKALDCEDRIIVCSGRGDPRGNLPKYARFIPVSGLLEWVIHNPSKFHLVNLLNHARRPKTGKRRRQ